jgi:DGQHR domain-containing protein
VNKISKYCEDPDATLPTPIIVSIYSGVDVVDKDHKFIFNVGEEERIGDVIDGQHRLMGIAKSGYSNRFKLPVALMFNMNVEEKAYVFSTINSTQTKVSMSLIYDLFDLSTKRSPQKTAHEIARSLNKMENSPFYNRLKMLGKKEPDQYFATLSQGTFVKQLLTLISRDPDEDSSRIKRGMALARYRLPFRQYFIEERDDVILKILMNCFTALKDVFDKEWKDPTRNVLWKTTGYGAIIKAFPYLYERGAERKDLSQDYFMLCFENLKRYMQGMNKDFSNKFFSGGGEQLQNKLAEDIRRAQESGLG